MSRVKEVRGELRSRRVRGDLEKEQQEVMASEGALSESLEEHKGDASFVPDTAENETQVRTHWCRESLSLSLDILICF